MKQTKTRRVTPWIMLPLFTIVGSPAPATPYFISYEADTPGSFPENEGWERLVSDGGAERSIESGILTLHDPAPVPDGKADAYRLDQNGQIAPEVGELWFAEWRMRTVQTDSTDVGVFIAEDTGVLALDFRHGETWFFSAKENLLHNLDGTIFHTYRIVSADMMNYSLFIEGEWIWDGEFLPGTVWSSSVVWGDEGLAIPSTSQWDYFRFGVIPIPVPSALPLLGVGLGLTFWTSKNTLLSTRSRRR